MQQSELQITSVIIQLRHYTDVTTLIENSTYSSNYLVQFISEAFE